MLGQFLKYGSTYCGVEHSFNATNVPVFNILSLKKKKKELQIENSKQFLEESDVFSFLKDQKHVFLTINTDQVLTKITDYIDEDEVKTIQNTFQNLNLKDFYYSVNSYNNTVFVTICRKVYVDDIIDRYKKKGIDVIGFSIGNTIVENIIPYIEETHFFTSNAKVTLSNEEIITIDSIFEQEYYIINELDVSSNDIVPLSGVLFGYFQGEKNITGFQGKIAELKKDFLDKRIFKVGLNFSLGLLLIILLINFLLFSSYSTKVNHLNSDLLIDENQKAKVTQLQEQIRVKEDLIKDLNNVLQSEISKYIDEIAVTVPKTILLDELNYQPLKSSVRFDKEMLFNKGSIVVKGTTKKDAEFSSWTGKFGKKKWIEEIIFQDFSNSKKGTSNFEFLIKIKND